MNDDHRPFFYVFLAVFFGMCNTDVYTRIFERVLTFVTALEHGGMDEIRRKPARSVAELASARQHHKNRLAIMERVVEGKGRARRHRGIALAHRARSGPLH